MIAQPPRARILCALLYATSIITACSHDDAKRAADADSAALSTADVDTPAAMLFAGDTVPRILQPADSDNAMSDEELGGDANGPWWALLEGSPPTLQRVEVVVDSVRAPCTPDEPERRARTVTVRGAQSVTLLLRGIALRSGALTTAIADTIIATPESPAGGTDSARFTFNGRPLRIWRSKAGDGFHVTVEWDGKQQVVFATDYEDEGSWDPVMVADFNRDGEPDLLLQASYKYSVRVLRLLLSQPAGSAARFREVATAERVAC